MIVHGVDTADLTGTDRGAAMGAARPDAIAATIGGYRQHFDRWGLAESLVADVAAGCAAQTRAWAPDLYDEQHASARASGVAFDDIAMLTSRTEILVATPRAVAECSVIAGGPAGAPAWCMQTWDWHSDVTPAMFDWTMRADSGIGVRTIAEPGMPAKFGVNDRGIGLLFTFLAHVSDRVGAGVPVHVVARRILDTATTLDEAIEIARSAPVTASVSLTVVEQHDPTGPADVATLEVSPHGVAIVRPRADGWRPHTNHFLDPQLATGEAVELTKTSWDRQDWLEELVATLPPDGGIEAVTRLCTDNPPAPICAFPDVTLPPVERVETMLTVRFDPARFGAEYLIGAPAGEQAAMR